jgi:hypothetical protein
MMFKRYTHTYRSTGMSGSRGVLVIGSGLKFHKVHYGMKRLLKKRLHVDRKPVSCATIAECELDDTMDGASIISQRAQLPFARVLCHSVGGSTLASWCCDRISRGIVNECRTENLQINNDTLPTRSRMPITFEANNIQNSKLKIYLFLGRTMLDRAATPSL